MTQLPEATRTTDLDALARRSELLFTQDERGRLQRVRETNGAAAPRFYFARSVLGNVWRFREDLPSEIVVKLARLAGKERPLRDLDGIEHAGLAGLPPPERVEAFRQVLREHAEIRHEYRGPAFRFPDLIPEIRELEGDSQRVALVRLDARREADRALLVNPSDPDALDLTDLAAPSDLLPQTDCFAIVRGDEVVSACWTSRFLPDVEADVGAGAAAEAGVRTREAYRGMGFALRVVAAWAGGMRESGTDPLYSTQWSNTASLHIAQKLGLVFCSEDLHFG